MHKRPKSPASSLSLGVVACLAPESSCVIYSAYVQSHLCTHVSVVFPPNELIAQMFPRNVPRDVWRMSEKSLTLESRVNRFVIRCCKTAKCKLSATRFALELSTIASAFGLLTFEFKFRALTIEFR